MFGRIEAALHRFALRLKAMYLVPELAVHLERRDDKVKAACKDEVRRAREHLDDVLAALQAIEVGFKERGHIIICARVAGRDRVKIINMQPEVPLKAYESMVRSITKHYGARAVYADGGDSLKGADIIKQEG